MHKLLRWIAGLLMMVPFLFIGYFWLSMYLAPAQKHPKGEIDFEPLVKDVLTHPWLWPTETLAGIAFAIVLFICGLFVIGFRQDPSQEQSEDKSVEKVNTG